MTTISNLIIRTCISQLQIKTNTIVKGEEVENSLDTYTRRNTESTDVLFENQCMWKVYLRNIKQTKKG